MAELISKLEERKEELDAAVVVERVVVEMSCSGRADGSWRQHNLQAMCLQGNPIMPDSIMGFLRRGDI